MKINITSKPDDIISTLAREWQMAIDAFITYKGGADKLDKWQDELLNKASLMHKGFVTDTYLWTSPDGNKWCIFEDVTYDNRSTYAHTCEYAFCYYETIPYAGILCHMTMPTMHGEKRDGAVIYESHLFERLNERGILKWEGMKTLVAFYSKNHSVGMYCTNPEKLQYDIRINGSICRGWAHRDNPMLIRMKTVLSDEMLSTKQRRDTARGRRYGDAVNKYIDLDFEAAMKRNEGRYAMAMMNGTTEELMNEWFRDLARQMDISTEEAKMITAYVTFVERVIGMLRPRQKKTMDLYDKIFEAAMKIKADWEENNDDEQNVRQMVCSIMEISKAFKMGIPKGSVIRVIHNMINQQQ